MSINNTRFTPKRRGPALSDGTGGPSERPDSKGKARDPVLYNVLHRTEDIRLTPTGTDADAGQGAMYILGNVDQKSVGRYLITQQGAASATAEPLGAISYMEVEVREQTAGVFNVSEVQHFDALVAAEDALQDLTNTVAAERATDDDALDFSASASADGLQLAVFIVTSTQATDIAAAHAATTGVAPVAGDMVIYDSQGASTRVYTITRLT